MNIIQQRMTINFVYLCFLLTFFLWCNGCLPIVSQSSISLETCTKVIYYEDFSDVKSYSVPKGWISSNTLNVVSKELRIFYG